MRKIIIASFEVEIGIENLSTLHDLLLLAFTVFFSSEIMGEF